MKDIYSIEHVSAWPLAAGWWFVIFILFAIGFVMAKKINRIRLYRKSWRYDIHVELEAIENNSDAGLAKKHLSRINDILKRLAIQIYGRDETAGLSGKKWLVWLTNYDPSHFSWVKNGEILINYPYMNEGAAPPDQQQVALLAKAAKAWLKVRV